MHFFLTFPAFFPNIKNNIYNLNVDKIIYFFITLVMIYLCGYKYFVGGDWHSLFYNFTTRDHYTLTDVFLNIDFSYNFVLYICNSLNLNFIYVNLILQIIFFTLLYLIAINQKNLRFIFSIFFPTVIFVFSFGFIKQGIACLIFYYGIILISKKNLNINWLLVFSILSLSFHTSAILFFFFFILIRGFTKKEFLTASFLFLIIIFLSKDFILNNYAKFNEIVPLIKLFKFYLFEEYNTSRAFYFRYILCLIPSVIFLLYLYERSKSNYENKFYFYLSVFNILMVLPSFFLNITIILDRFLMYSLPFQAIVYSNLLEKFDNNFIKNYIKIFLLVFFLVYTYILLYFNQSIELWFYRLYYDIYDKNLDNSDYML